MIVAILIAALSFIDAKNLRTASSSKTISDVVCASVWSQCGGQLNGQPMVIYYIISILENGNEFKFCDIVCRQCSAALVDQYVTKWMLAGIIISASPCLLQKLQQILYKQQNHYLHLALLQSSPVLHLFLCLQHRNNQVHCRCLLFLPTNQSIPHFNRQLHRF